MVEGTFYIYLSPMLGSLTSWVGWQLAHWFGHVIGGFVHLFQVVVIALIYAGLCGHLLYWNLIADMTLIPCGYSGFWCGVLKAKRSSLVGVWDGQCSMLRDSPFPARFHLVFRFFPCKFSLQNLGNYSVES
jgi:hypothetical protein